MKLKKKLATVVAMAAIFGSIVAPVTAKAGCSHLWSSVDGNINSYTYTHGAIGGGTCTVTVTEKEEKYRCSECKEYKTERTTTYSHSAPGCN